MKKKKAPEGQKKKENGQRDAERKRDLE